MLSHFRRAGPCVTPWTAARQAPVQGTLQAMTLEGVAVPSPGDLPARGSSLPRVSPALAGGFLTTSTTWGAQTTTAPWPWRKGRFTKVHYLSSEIAGAPFRVFSGVGVQHLASRGETRRALAALTQEPLSTPSQLPSLRPSAPPPSFLMRINHDLRRGTTVRGKPHPQ